MTVKDAVLHYPTFRQRQWHDRRFGRPDQNLSPRHTYFTPDIPQRDCLCSTVQKHRGRAGDLANLFFPGNDFHSCVDLACTFCEESRELAVDSPSGANAFDNLLTDIASLIEIQ